MGVYTNLAKNTMLDALTQGPGPISHASLHDGFPGLTGTNEISGGTPAYARQAITFAAAAGGAAAANVQPTFDVPAAASVQWVGFWDAVTAGNFYVSGPVGSSLAVPFCADATSDVFASEAHGLVDAQQVVLISTRSEALPGGFTEGDIYFVVNANANDFQLEASIGGGAINVTSPGEGFIMDIVPEAFAGQGSFQLTAATLDLHN